MKTLRLVRNIAVLFILVMGLLASRPGPAVAAALSPDSPATSIKAAIATKLPATAWVLSVRTWAACNRANRVGPLSTQMSA